MCALMIRFSIKINIKEVKYISKTKRAINLFNTIPLHIYISCQYSNAFRATCEADSLVTSVTTSGLDSGTQVPVVHHPV